MSETVFGTQRWFPHSPASVLHAFSSAERLARWWGPVGFSISFDVFHFRPGGRWEFTMHSPDGTHHPNQSRFRETGPTRVVIEHVSRPRFVLTVSLADENGGTRVDWEQAFEDADDAERVRHIVEPANEQNLDRLGEELARGA